MLRSSALAVALTLAACASGPPVRLLRRPAPLPNVRAVAVYPYAFRWDEPAWHAHAKAMDAVLAVSARNRVLVFGPDDFQVFSAASDDPRAGTDLVPVLAASGLPPTAFVALRGWAERRIARVAGTVEGRGRAASAVHEETTWVAHLEALDGGGGGVLLELVAQVRRDPTRADPWDPAPELTALHRRLVEVAWEELSAKLPARRLAPMPVAVRWVPGAPPASTPHARSSPGETLGESDPIEASLARLSVLRYFDRESGDAELARRARLPGGLLVQAGGAWAPPLREGDLVLAVDGKPAAGPHVLQRAVNLSRGPIALAVLRDGRPLPVTVAAPRR
jgi:hypothetical protein